jgi:hypothetical protein
VLLVRTFVACDCPPASLLLPSRTPAALRSSSARGLRAQRMRACLWARATGGDVTATPAGESQAPPAPGLCFPGCLASHRAGSMDEARTPRAVAPLTQAQASCRRPGRPWAGHAAEPGGHLPTALAVVRLAPGGPPRGGSQWPPTRDMRAPRTHGRAWPTVWRPGGITQPYAASHPRLCLTKAGRSLTNWARRRWRAGMSCGATRLSATKRLGGRRTAAQLAAAS